MDENHWVRRLRVRGGEWEKKRGSGGVTPLRFVAYGGCDFILRRKDPINQSFP